MTSALLVALVAVLVAFAGGAGLMYWLKEQELGRVRTLAATDREFLRAQVEDRSARIDRLEFQLGSLVALRTGAAPPPPPSGLVKPRPTLPRAVATFLEGIEDDEARAEYEQHFRRQLERDPNADPDRLVTDALGHALSVA